MQTKPLTFIGLVIFAFMIVACAGSGSGSAVWKSPDYASVPYEKVLVFAKTNDATDRRMLEDAVVAALKQQGLTADPTYNEIIGEHLQSAEKIGAKAIALGGDALLVFSGARMSSEYKRGPSMNASVGVPVKIGFANVWLGGSVPLGGGGRSVPIVNIDVSFYNKAGTGPQWTMKISDKATGNIPTDIASKVSAQLKKDGILP